MPDRILLSEWAGPGVGAGLLGAAGWDRSPCPVCGHPTGDCTHDVPGGHAIMTTPSKAPKDRAAQAQADHVKEVVSGDQDVTDAGLNDNERISTTAGIGKDAVVAKDDSELGSDIYEVSDTAEFVTLQKDVVEEFFYPDTKRPSYRVLYTKGQVVSKAAIEAHNAGVRARAALKANDGVDPQNPAGIDSTTLASGTNAHLAQQEK